MSSRRLRSPTRVRIRALSFESLAGSHHLGGFAGVGWEAAFKRAIYDRVNYFTELSTIELRGFPAALQIVGHDLLVAIEQFLPEGRRQRRKHARWIDRFSRLLLLSRASAALHANISQRIAFSLVSAELTFVLPHVSGVIGRVETTNRFAETARYRVIE